MGFEFDLAFTKKDVTPRPAAIKLLEALQAIGYNGPIVTDLNMIQMYVARIAELPPNVTASFGYNVDLGQVVLQADVPRPLPCNVTLAQSLYIFFVNQGGGYAYKPSRCICNTGRMDLPNEWRISNDNAI